MSLSAIQKNADLTGRQLEAGPVAPVRIEVIRGNGIDVGLLVDGPLGKAGTRLTLRQPETIRGIKLDDIARGRPEVDGRKAVPRSAVGDILVFERGVVDGAELVVGKLATRMHDDFQNVVQAARVFARPGRSSVSKRGAIQFTVIADPSKAFVTADAEAFREIAKRELSAAWPGGRAGFILRDKQNTLEILCDQDDKWTEPVDEFIERLLTTNCILDEGPVEAIPIWSLQVGRDQVTRDVDPRKPTEGPVAGPFTSMYAASKDGRTFLPSIAILTDEDEWAFGGRTGRSIRVIAGLHPLRTDLDLKPATLPTQARNRGQLPTPMRFLYRSDADAVAARDARLARKQPTKPEAETTSAPPRSPLARSAR